MYSALITKQEHYTHLSFYKIQLPTSLANSSLDTHVDPVLVSCPYTYLSLGIPTGI